MRKSIFLSSTLLVLILGFIGLLSLSPAPAYSQDITDNIPYLLGANIYFNEINREPSPFDRSDEGLSRFAGLLRMAGANLQSFDLSRGIPPDADLIVIIAPTFDLNSTQVAFVWEYIQNGGSVLMGADALENPRSTTRALSTRGIFEVTWFNMGLYAREDVIVREGDMQDVEIRQTNDAGEVTFEFVGELPEISIQFLTTALNPDHPITSGLVGMVADETEEQTNLNSLMFDGVRSIEIDGGFDSASVTPLVFTDDANMYGETDYNDYIRNGYIEYNIDDDTARDDLIVAAAYENPLGTRMVLIGDGDMVINGKGFATSPSYTGAFVYPMNVQFMLRSVAWLLDRDPAPPELPTPMATPTATVTPTPLPEDGD